MNLRGKSVLITLLLIICGTSFSTHALGADYSLDFSSRYIWRGFDLNPNNKPVLQPSATFNLGNSGINANVWGSISFEDSELNELDFTLSYDINKFEDISLSVGFIHYGWYFADNFKFKDNTTQEVYVSAGFNKIPLNPTISLYYDFNNGDGLYATLGLNQEIKISQNHNLDLSAILGYNDGQWIEKSGFSDLSITASLPFKYNKVKISPFVSTVFILMDEVNPNVDSEILYGVSFEF